MTSQSRPLVTLQKLNANPLLNSTINLSAFLNFHLSFNDIDDPSVSQSAYYTRFFLESLARFDMSKWPIFCVSKENKLFVFKMNGRWYSSWEMTGGTMVDIFQHINERHQDQIHQHTGWSFSNYVIEEFVDQLVAQFPDPGFDFDFSEGESRSITFKFELIADGFELVNESLNRLALRLDAIERKMELR